MVVYNMVSIFGVSVNVGSLVSSQSEGSGQSYELCLLRGGAPRERVRLNDSHKGYNRIACTSFAHRVWQGDTTYDLLDGLFGTIGRCLGTSHLPFTTFK
jgi:hypothetical protein